MASDSIVPSALAPSSLIPPGAGNLTGAGNSTGANAKPTNAKEAATQFEGLLIAAMLRSAHESNPGSLGGDDDDNSQSDTVFDIAAEQFAQVMAQQGGFGIAKIVNAGLSRQQASNPNAEQRVTGVGTNPL
jgi:Rod binding domain-containing protein